MKRPITVLVALGFMGLQCLASLFPAYLTSAYLTTSKLSSNLQSSVAAFSWGMAAGFVVIELALMYLILSRRDWGRILYAGLTIAGIIYEFAMPHHIFTGLPSLLRSAEIIHWISLAATLIALVLLFVPQSNAWFGVNDRSEMRPDGPPKGRWGVQWWRIVFVIVLTLFAGYVAINAIPNSRLIFILLVFGLGPFIALACAILLGAFTWKEVRRGRTREMFRVLAQVVAGLLVSFILISMPNARRSVATRAVWLIRLAYSRNELLILAHGLSPPLAAIPLGGLGSMTTGIAYDPSAQILLPATRRSASWTKEADQTDLGVQGLQVTHIIGPYYWWFHY